MINMTKTLSTPDVRMKLKNSLKGSPTWIREETEQIAHAKNKSLYCMDCSRLGAKFMIEPTS